MFDRKRYKKEALQQLKGKWSQPLRVVFSAGLYSLVISLLPDLLLPTEQYNSYLVFSYPITGAISAVLFMAMMYFFMHFSKNNEITTYKTFIEGFSLWIKALLSALWFSLWTLLWLLLFIIPGFIKVYSYYEMFFIIAENPHVGVKKAMKLSKIITKGNKGDLFFLDLSFLGWYLLSFIPGIVFSIFAGFNVQYLDLFVNIGTVLILLGIYFIIRYHQLAQIGEFRALNQSAIDRKELTPEDFGEKSPVEAIEQ